MKYLRARIGSLPAIFRGERLIGKVRQNNLIDRNAVETFKRSADVLSFVEKITKGELKPGMSEYEEFKRKLSIAKRQAIIELLVDQMKIKNAIMDITLGL